MNSNSNEICRLCFESSNDSVFIFDKFQNSTIASVLTKHFWFQVDKNDGMSEWLCEICWIQIKTFHQFYKRIEFRHATPRQPFKLVSVDEIKRERSDSPGMVMPSLNTIKCEETGLTFDSESCGGENSFDCDDQGVVLVKNEAADENLQVLNDDEQISEEKSKTDSDKDDSDTDNRTLAAHTKLKFYKHLSPSEQEEENVQIRQFFDMKCELCDDVEFQTLPEAKEHYRSVHKMRGYLMCCRRRFWRRYMILEHIRHHINPNAFRCDQCYKSFYNEESLKNHMEYHLPPELRTHKCSLCEKSYTNSSALKFHMETKHSSAKFPCDKCDKIFRSKASLTSHIRQVHVFTLEHVCEICARRFKTKEMLRSHYICEHTTRPKAQCNLCGAWLKHESSLRGHMRRLHQESVSECETLNCSICNKLVKNKQALRHHMRRAHGGRKHQCAFCDKAFHCAQNLKEHVACHTGEDLYNCPYCDKKFKSNANMYSHRKNLHLAEWSRDRSTTTRVRFNEKTAE